MPTSTNMPELKESRIVNTETNSVEQTLAALKTRLNECRTELAEREQAYREAVKLVLNAQGEQSDPLWNKALFDTPLFSLIPINGNTNTQQLQIHGHFSTATTSQRIGTNEQSANPSKNRSLR